MKPSVFALVGFGGVLFAGCTGVTPSAQTQRRIEEKSGVFNALDASQKNDILGGAIEKGFSMDMVYLSLGKPNRIVTSADGVKAMWVYQEYSSSGGGTVTTSFNNPNASHYIPLYTSSSAPVSSDEGHSMSGATPGHSEGLPVIPRPLVSLPRGAQIFRSHYRCPS